MGPESRVSNPDDRQITGTAAPEDEEGPLILGGRRIREGDRIGAYVFVREVGSGGMARVLLARAPNGDAVALKVLRQSRIETGLTRFRREFHALSRLDHPNVVRVFAYGDLHGHPYIAMEFVDGPDLHTVIRGFRTWDEDRRYQRAEEILIDLCRALAAIHRRGLVHRDLKPSNILLTGQGVCKLTDFGIVKDMDPGRTPELSTTLVGTWAYTSPEHIMGRPVDHRSDLYALGVILFAMLTGKRPFAADSMAGYLEAHRDKPAPRASDLRPSVPPVLDEICARLLSKAPRDRFQSAQEILYRLEADDPQGAMEGQDTWQPPLVGHDDVLEAVEEAVFALTDGRPNVVQILAEDGMGRSRMLEAAVDRARMLGLPFHLLSFDEEAPAYTAAIRLARELLREAPEEDEVELRRIVAAWSEGAALRGDTRYALYDGLRAMLTTLLEDRPRLLLCDDLHLAQPDEADLIRYLARHLTGQEAPLLVVATGRPKGESASDAWRQGMEPVVLHLRPLGEADLALLVGSLLGPGRATDTLARRLHAETEGNPFFVTEFLRSLMAQGLLTQSEGVWRATLDLKDLAEGHLEIPPGIRVVLRSRLATVQSQDLEVLEALAVAGLPADLDLLLDVLDLEEEVLLQRLDRLIIAGLVRELRGADELRYRVVHRKLADLIRHDLPEGRRQALHRACAIALEAGQAQDADTMEVIGEHYRQAGDAARAYEHLAMAARRLVERSMPDAGWTLSEHAVGVELAARGELQERRFRELRAQLLHARGEIQRHRGQWTPAADSFQELVALAEDLGDERAAAEARIGLSHALRRRGDLEASLTAGQEALAASRRLHFRKGVTEALHALAGLAWGEGDLDQVEALADEGLLLCQGPALATQRATLLMTRSAAQATRGQLASAVKGMAEADALFQELRMKPLRVIAMSNRSELHAWQGEADEAWNLADQAVHLAQDLGFSLGLASALRCRGVAATDLGRYRDAQDDLEQAREASRAIGVEEEELAACVALTRLSLEQYDMAGAIRQGSAALELTSGRDPERYLPLLHALLARTLARRRSETAWTLLQAVEDALPTLHTPRRLQVRLATAWAWLAIGDKARATQHAQELVRDTAARPFRLLSLEARVLLGSTTSGEEARRHKRIGAELARDFTDSLPMHTSDEVRKRPLFRYFADP